MHLYNLVKVTVSTIRVKLTISSTAYSVPPTHSGYNSGLGRVSAILY